MAQNEADIWKGIYKSCVANSAIYTIGVIYAGVAFNNKATVILGLATAGASYLCAEAQITMDQKSSLGALALATASILLGIAAGISLLVQ